MGQIIGNARYWEGHYKLGHQTIHGVFVAEHSYLAFKDLKDDREVLAIPWPNIQKIQGGSVPKKIGGQIVKLITWFTPLGSVSRMGDEYLVGFSIVYEEPNVGQVSPFFVINKYNRRDRIMREIWTRRNQFLAGAAG